MMSEAVLSIKALCHGYVIGKKELPVLKNLDLEVKKGEWLCIFGASGSGKTTLLNLIGTLEHPQSGKIIFDSTDISTLSRSQAAQFRGRYLGFVFQSYHLIPELSVLDNVALAGHFAGINSANSRKKAAELLERVGLKERIHHLPNELSGGERQRCAIARALLNDPKLLLADEPTGNLDAATGQEILDLFIQLRRENPDLAIVMITHNRDLAILADRSLTLENGCFKEN